MGEGVNSVKKKKKLQKGSLPFFHEHVPPSQSFNVNFVRTF